MRSTRRAFVAGMAGLASVGSLVCLALGVPSITRGDDPVGRARSFLDAVSHPDGSFGRTPIIDTVEAISALEPGDRKDAALFALSLARPDNTEATIARLWVLRGTPFEDFGALQVHREAFMAGAANLAPGTPGDDPLVLAWMIRLAALDGGDVPLLERLVAAIEAIQRADGGFGFADNPSDPALTAELARSLGASAMAPALASAGLRARSWLVQDGGGASLPDADLALLMLGLGDRIDAGDKAAMAATLIARQAADGSFDGGDVRATALAVQALRGSLPDLELRLPLVMPDAPSTGDPYAISVHVWNKGSLAAPPGDIGIRVVDQAGNAVFSGSVAAPALAAGAGASVTVDLGLQGATGARRVSVVANPELAFSEASTANNVVTFDYRVAAPADLVIEPADIAFAPSPPVVFQAIDVTVHVRNVGDAVAHDVHVQLFQGHPSSGGVLVSEALLNAVAPGVPRTLTGKVIPKTLDAIELFARVDPEGAVLETDDSNNTSSVATTPVQPADLTVDLRGDVSATSYTVHQGDKFSITYRVDASVQRFGGGYHFPELWPFRGAAAVLYANASGSPIEISRDYFTAHEIAYGPPTSLAFSTSGWADGTYAYTIVTDPSDEVPDVNPANDTKTITVSVETAGVAELWMEPLVADPAGVSPGAPLTVRGTLRNTGKATARDVPVKIALGTWATTMIVPELPAGASAEVSQVITTPASPGTYSFSFDIDPQGTIAESSKANNASSCQFRVLGWDLEVLSITVAPDPVPAGQPATVIAQVKNVGVTVAPYLDSQVVQVASNGSVQGIGSASSTAYPAPGTTATLTIPITTGALVGETAARLYFIPSGNLQSFTIRALNPDFSVTTDAMSFTPAAPSPGDTITPTVVVSNNGSLTAATSVRVYRGYRESNDLASEGTITVPAGGSATFFGPPFALQAAAPYIVTVVLDEENAHAEPDEGNNQAVRNALKGDGAIIVAFDQTREQLVTIPATGTYQSGGYPDWARDLTARGYTIKSINPGPEGFTAAALVGVDVVVNVLPMTRYSPSELAAWNAFLRSGGGLLFIGDWGSDASPPSWQDGSDDFLSHLFGVTSLHEAIGGLFPTFQPWASPGYGTILPHPTTTGLQSVCGNLTGGFSQLPDGAQVLLTSGGYLPPDRAAAAAFERGGGRVVLLGDSQVFDSGVYCTWAGCVVPFLYEGNRRFGLQVIDWLVNGGAHDYLPDLAIVPASIATSSDSPVAGEEFTATVIVRNVGGSPAPSSGALLRLYDGAPSGGTLLGESPLDGLAVDGEQVFEFRWDTTRAAGDHVLTAVVDPDGDVPELDEQNNIVTRALIVRASHDLRVDPSDIVPSRDDGRTLAVTVHNVGYDEVPGGTRLLVTDRTADGQATTSVHLGTVPARGAATIAMPWAAIDAAQAHVVTVTADADRQLIDPTREDDTATATFSPPTLEIASPVPGTEWGGVKDVTWDAASDEGALTFFVAIAAEGGPFTGLGSTTSRSFTFDTRTHADGPHRLRVTASDGVLQRSREVQFTIANVQAVRAFAGGGATVSVPAGDGASEIALPVSSRVSSATMALTPVPSTSIVAPSNPTPLGLFDVDGALWFFTSEMSGSNVVLGRRVSRDGGATWSPLASIATFPMISLRATIARNRYGFHIAYSITGSWGPPQYIRSADGINWSPPVPAQAGQLAGSDEGLLLVSQTGLATISQGSPDGAAWGSARAIAGVVNQSLIRATVAGGEVHVAAADGASLRYYRSPLGADTALAGSLSAPVVLDGAGVSDATLLAAQGSLFLAYSTFRPGAGWQVWAQRCELARDCTRRDAWLPAPASIGAGSAVDAGMLRPDLLGLVWPNGHGFQQANGIEGGKRFSPAFASRIGSLGSSRFVFGDEFLGVVGMGQGYSLFFDRSPGLTPTDVIVDVGRDGTPELARPGMPGSSAQLQDFAAAVNSYLATHGDGDDGVADGLIRVPLTITSRGVGQTTLRNLEVRYQLLGEIAGFAEPPLFSPGESFGVLDGSTLSLLSSGPVALMTQTGSIVRTLATTAEGDRHVAAFDGRDDAGVLLPSGSYLFGAPGWPVGAVEIDNLPPTAILNAGAEGSYGGVAAIRGVATDADHSGTSKNFARYVLEYTLDGAGYQPIATGTSPVSGELGLWDTRGLVTDGATLRLTVFDRAGNSASATRSVKVAPGAPTAPVIDTPTFADAPVDSVSATITVGGSAERNTTVTVLVNDLPAGETACDGRWSLSGVGLPEGIATITASASRGGLESPRAEPIQVARYALAVGVTAPPSAVVGADITATVTTTRTSVLARPLGIRVHVVDSAGNPTPVAVSPSERVLSLPGQGSESFDVVLSTAGAVPASYRIVAEVVSGGLIPASGSMALEIGSVTTVAATLASDRAIYEALQGPVLTVGVRNTGHAETGALTGSITVIGPDGASAVIGPMTLPTIASGDWGSRSLLFGTPPLLVGAYVAEVVFRDVAGAAVGRASTSFAVQSANGSDSLRGTLLARPSEYRRGDVLSVEFEVANVAGPSEVPVSVLLVEADSGAVAARHDTVMAVAPGTSGGGTVQLSTAGSSGGELLVVLVGRGRGLAGQAIAPTPWSDDQAPLIAITGFTDGEYRSGAVTPVITITDESPFTSNTLLSGQPFVSGTEVNEDGEYLVAVRAVDVFDNVAEASASFVIDTEPPRVSVVGVEPGEMTNEPRAPEVAFEDLHLRSSRLTLDGEPFTSGVEITGDGDYRLEAWADDRAGNGAGVEVLFTIDRTPPVVVIDGVVEAEVTKETLFVSVSMTEAHPSERRVLLDGMTWDELPIATEGDHVLTVEASDLAGNTVTGTVAFTIDKTPPAIAVAGISEGALVNEAVQPLVTVVDPHAPEWSTTVDGVPWDGTTIAAEGDHALLVTAWDDAGNRSTHAVRFTIDRTPPRITLAGVRDGELTNRVVVPSVAVEDAHLDSTAIRLDGSPFESGAGISTEGDHVLSVEATDGAGNNVSVVVAFTIDRTPPEITVSGVAPGETSLTPVTITFSARDPHDATVEATLDGAPFLSGGGVSVNGSHELVITAHDGAGNSARRNVPFTLFVVDASLTISIDPRPRVLVGLDCCQGGCRGREDDGKGAGRDDHHHHRDEEDGHGDHRGDDRSPDGIGSGSSRRSHEKGSCHSCQLAEAAFLLNTLDAAAIGYDVAADPAEFVQLFRTHRHRVRVLYRGHPSEDRTDEELREATWAGGGLVVVNGKSSDVPKLEEALGARMSSTMQSLGTLSMSEGVLGPERTIDLTGRGVAQRLLGASSQGRARGRTLVSTHQYGSGRAVTITFDPEAVPTPAVADLMVRAVVWAGGGERGVLVPGEEQELLLNAGSGMYGSNEFVLTAHPGPGLEVRGEEPVWTFSLGQGEALAQGLTVTATDPGTYRVDATLAVRHTGATYEAMTVGIELTWPKAAAELKADAVAEVAVLDGCTRGRVLSHLLGIDPTPESRREAESSIADAVDALEGLAAAEAQGELARTKVSALLRALEIQFTYLP